MLPSMIVASGTGSYPTITPVGAVIVERCSSPLSIPGQQKKAFDLQHKE